MAASGIRWMGRRKHLDTLHQFPMGVVAIGRACHSVRAATVVWTSGGQRTARPTESSLRNGITSIVPPFLHPAIQPVIGKWFWIVPAGSIPARFHSTAEAQTGANGRANVAKPTRVSFASRFRTQSNPGPTGAARSKPFSAAGRIPVPAREVSVATIPAFHFFAARNQRPRLQTTASPADNSPAWSATARI